MSKIGAWFLDMQDAHYRNDCYQRCYFCTENEKYRLEHYEDIGNEC
jgi:hypothetical protein